jgi:hypothetical protein
MSALTNSGVKVGKKVTYYGDKEKLMKAANDALGDRGSDIGGLHVNPGTSVVDAAPSQTAEIAAPTMVDPRLRQPRRVTPADTPDEAAPSIHTEGGGISVQTNKAPVPTISKPSLYEATHDQNGLEKPINGAETKLGKLLHIVFASARGSAAGAGSRTFGQGYAAAQQLPNELAQQRQTVAHTAEATKNEELQGQVLQDKIDDEPADSAIRRLLLQSEIERNKAQGNYYTAGVDKRERNTDQQALDFAKELDSHPQYGVSGKEYLSGKFHIPKEKYFNVEQTLMYGDPTSPEYGVAQKIFSTKLANEHQGDQRAERKEQFEKDVRDVVGQALSSHGNKTNDAIADLTARIGKQGLSDRARQAAIQALLELRKSGLSSTLTR